MTDIGIDITLKLDHFRIYDFGGDGQNASPKKLALLSKRLKALVKSVLAGSPSKYPAAELSGLRRIILSGNPPASEFQKVREVTVKLFPDFENRFVGGIDPRWVAAVGAAKLVRLFKFHQGRFEGDPGYEYVGSHDEL